MREIKFRAWDVPGKRWMDEHSIYALLKECQMTGHDYGFRYVVEQFTGLHDKNGREIYEGDILKSPGWACLCVVEWRNGGFVLPQGETAHTLGTELDDLREYQQAEAEVIGNRWENPELFKSSPPLLAGEGEGKTE